MALEDGLNEEELKKKELDNDVCREAEAKTKGRKAAAKTKEEREGKELNREGLISQIEKTAIQELKDSYWARVDEYERQSEINNQIKGRYDIDWDEDRDSMTKEQLKDILDAMNGPF